MSNKKTSGPSSGLSHAVNRRMMLDLDEVFVVLGGQPVLENVNLCIHQGEFIGLIGPNGAGKTTLLRVMLGLLQPQKGKIAFAHEVKVAYVPQRGSAMGATVPVSVGEVVAMGSTDQTAIAKALMAVHLTDLAGKRFGELSGGQQQRVLVARALAGQAQLLILDEPTTGIDDAAEQEFFGILKTLRHQGVTILMVSHDLEAVLDEVDRVICLNRRVLYDGRPQDFEVERYWSDMYATKHRQLHHQHPEAIRA